jgi:hypothetical protein
MPQPSQVVEGSDCFLNPFDRIRCRKFTKFTATVCGSNTGTLTLHPSSFHPFVCSRPTDCRLAGHCSSRQQCYKSAYRSFFVSSFCTVCSRPTVDLQAIFKSAQAMLLAQFHRFLKTFLAISHQEKVFSVLTILIISNY